MNYFCNPINVPYHYQFSRQMMSENIEISREAADPSMILFQGRYYMFPSMNLSVWVSDDLVNWESHALPENLPLYDYAPDVRVIGDYVYFSASRRGKNCDFYRTKDVLNGPYEKIEGTFAFWDPNLFEDEDGKVYFYWGSSNVTPIYGVEMNPETMKRIGEPQELIFGNAWDHGYERVGENNSIMPRSEKEIDEHVGEVIAAYGVCVENLPEKDWLTLRGCVSQKPYIEGAWMTKYNGKYYLQYAFSETQSNVYGDGVYVSDKPLGPFTLAQNNPYSFMPEGFLSGAGHGSTMEDKEGTWWHASTMRISVNQQFERRVGLWPAGFDEDGELFCNQRYGDWPMSIDRFKKNPWAEPEWMLLSCGKKMEGSSFEAGKEPEKAAQENVRTWWRAATNEPGQWLKMDLGKEQDVRAIQINFADDKLDIPVPGEICTDVDMPRYIAPELEPTCWLLEGSIDGENWETLSDKTDTSTCLPHDLVVLEEGAQVRYIKLTVIAVPYNQPACISGLRVFGNSEGEKPSKAEYTVERLNGEEMFVKASARGSVGYNILWGHSPEKLYHSWIVYGDCEQKISALVKGREYYVRVDAFNECGITAGDPVKL